MKTLLITGVSGSLGKVVVRYFLEKGHRIIGTIRDPSSKKDMPSHENLYLEVVDLLDEANTTSFVESAIQSYGKIDAALLLVGGFTAGNISETGSADIKSQIDLNFYTAYHVARPLLAHMTEKNNGRIVLIGSRPALSAAAGKNVIAYGLAKSLLFKFADYLNAEVKGKNVSATVLVPGTIDTETNRRNMPDADTSNWVKPEILAELLDFVTSEKAAGLRDTILKVYNS